MNTTDVSNKKAKHNYAAIKSILLLFGCRNNQNSLSKTTMHENNVRISMII